MYFLLILFFISLFGIIFMISRKLVVLHKSDVLYNDEILHGSPFLEEWRQSSVEGIKKYSYSALVAIIRFYVRGTDIVKSKYQGVKIRIKNARGQNLNSDAAKKREVSGFLKLISEYKRKVRKIKRKIKEEGKKT